MTLENITHSLLHYLPVDLTEKRMVEETIAFIDSFPQCLERNLSIGHITASAWITERSKRFVLLTHHRKLDKWFQLGGHADGEANLQKVAITEAIEESGLQELTFVSEEIFDVDVHQIPARPKEASHLHYDVRFLLEGNMEEPLIVNHESKALVWVPIEEVIHLNESESVQRMVRKHKEKFFK
jgi:hypothetical protein